MKADLINNLIKHTVVKTVLNKDSKDQTSKAIQITINTQTNEDMFALPDMVPSVSNLQSYIDDDQDDSDSHVELSPRKQSKWMGNIHNVDVTSNEFKALPADVRYDILTDLKETRKQNSWGRLYEMPQVCTNVKQYLNCIYIYIYIYIYMCVCVCVQSNPQFEATIVFKLISYIYLLFLISYNIFMLCTRRICNYFLFLFKHD